jgi:hypothetical protein
MNAIGHHDVFLSHRYADRESVERLHDHIEKELGYSVYVDWIERPDFDRSQVTREAAEHFRQVMRSCSVLIFYAGPNAPESKWMPWELGFFDGRQGARRIAVYADDLTAYDPAQQEYLRLYRIVDRDSLPGFLDAALNDTAAMTSATYDQWRRHMDKLASDPMDYGLSVVQWWHGVTANALLDPERLETRGDEQPTGPLREPASLYAPWYRMLRAQQEACAQARRNWRSMRRALPAPPPGFAFPIPKSSPGAAGEVHVTAGDGVAFPGPAAGAPGDYAAFFNNAFAQGLKLFLPRQSTPHPENFFT